MICRHCDGNGAVKSAVAFGFKDPAGCAVGINPVSGNAGKTEARRKVEVASVSEHAKCAGKFRGRSPHSRSGRKSPRREVEICRSGAIVKRGKHFCRDGGRIVVAQNLEGPNFRVSGRECFFKADGLDFQMLPGGRVFRFRRGNGKLGFAEKRVVRGDLRDADAKPLSAHFLRDGNTNFLLGLSLVCIKRGNTFFRFVFEDFDERTGIFQTASPKNFRRASGF